MGTLLTAFFFEAPLAFFLPDHGGFYLFVCLLVGFVLVCLVWEKWGISALRTPEERLS